VSVLRRALCVALALLAASAPRAQPPNPETSQAAPPRPPKLTDLKALLDETQPLRIGLGAAALVGVRPSVAAAVFAAGSDTPLHAVAPGDLVSAQVVGGAMEVASSGWKSTATGEVQVRMAHGDGRTSVRLPGSAAGPYPGDFALTLAGDRVQVINLVSLTDYVARVMSAELPPHWSVEAAKAIAIVTRSYSLASIGDHLADGYDLCSGVHCQLYQGKDPDPDYADAVHDTKGLVLAYDGRVVKAYYSSHCGGISERRPWPGDTELIPYLFWRRDDSEGEPPYFADDAEFARWLHGEGVDPKDVPYCEQVHRGGWSWLIEPALLQKLVEQNLPRLAGATEVGEVRAVRIAGRDPSWRVDRLEVETATGTYTVTGEDIRWLFGDGVPSGNGLPSRLFIIRPTGMVDGGRPVLSFDGTGHGHGWGLCQWGTLGRARAGQSAREILAHYFPTAALVDAR